MSGSRNYLICLDNARCPPDTLVDFPNVTVVIDKAGTVTSLETKALHLKKQMHKLHPICFCPVPVLYYAGSASVLIDLRSIGVVWDSCNSTFRDCSELTWNII